MLPWQKLTWTEVRALRADLAADPSQNREAMAARYGIAQSTLIGIIAGYSWKDPGYTPPPRHPNAKGKINWTKAREIRELRLSGMILKDIAARFGVSAVLVHKICHGELWARDPVRGIAVPIVPVVGLQPCAPLWDEPHGIEA